MARKTCVDIVYICIYDMMSVSYVMAIDVCFEIREGYAVVV